jgi:putative cell wall-binding protein
VLDLEPTTPTAPIEVDRIAGADRTRTAAALALQSFPQPHSADVVVLARDDVFADGLSGSPLAGTLHGPLLLTNSLRLSVAAADAVDAVLAPGGTVVVLGGPRAVSPHVVAELTASGYDVERVGGADRFRTATLIADRIGRDRTIRRIFLATGLSFPDALSASSAAGLTDGVVVLTAGTTMPASTAGWLARHADLRTTAVGGGAAAAAPGASALAGPDRYATAARVARSVARQAEGLVLVTGADFPDGLAAASFASDRSWPMLLVDPQATALNPAQTTYLDEVRGGVRDLMVVGGTTAVPRAAAELVRRHLE